MLVVVNHDLRHRYREWDDYCRHGNWYLYFVESFGQTSPFKGTEYNDVIFGGIERDRLSGGRGNDTISGNAGNDEIYGDDGNDVLNGGAGYDDLRGGNGNDTLQGTNSGIGESDALRGGTENDLFILGDTTRVFYDDGFSTTQGTSDYAIIYDFNPTDEQFNYGVQVVTIC